MTVPGITFRWNGKEISKELQERAYFGALAAANHFAARLKDNLRKTKGSVVPPVHSQPGEVPFWITKTYHKSIKIRRRKRQHTVQIISDDPKGLWLEFGTWKMAPRPAWRITLNAEKAQMAEIIGKAMGQQVTIDTDIAPE